MCLLQASNDFHNLLVQGSCVQCLLCHSSRLFHPVSLLTASSPELLDVQRPLVPTPATNYSDPGTGRPHSFFGLSLKLRNETQPSKHQLQDWSVWHQKFLLLSWWHCWQQTVQRDKQMNWSFVPKQKSAPQSPYTRALPGHRGVGPQDRARGLTRLLGLDSTGIATASSQVKGQMSSRTHLYSTPGKGT